MEKFKPKQFAFVVLIVSLWINASEVFRYFVLIRPRVQSFFEHKPGIAAMNWSIFSVWGFWDMLLTAILVFVFWLYARSFGNNIGSVLMAGTLVWLSVFVIFWVAAANMGFADWGILTLALPLSWFEMAIGSWMASKLYARSGRT